jgi:hypothetical protein
MATNNHNHQPLNTITSNSPESTTIHHNHQPFTQSSVIHHINSHSPQLTAVSPGSITAKRYSDQPFATGISNSLQSPGIRHSHQPFTTSPDTLGCGSVCSTVDDVWDEGCTLADYWDVLYIHTVSTG